MMPDSACCATLRRRCWCDWRLKGAPRAGWPQPAAYPCVVNVWHQWLNKSVHVIRETVSKVVESWLDVLGWQQWHSHQAAMTHTQNTTVAFLRYYIACLWKQAFARYGRGWDSEQTSCHNCHCRVGALVPGPPRQWTVSSRYHSRVRELLQFASYNVLARIGRGGSRRLGAGHVQLRPQRQAGRRLTTVAGGSDVDADAADDGVIVSIARTVASTSRWRRSALSNGAGRCRRRAVATGRRSSPAAPCVRPGYAPRQMHGMLAHFVARLYIAVVCKITYGSFISQSTCGSYRIVSRYFVWYRIVSIVFSYGCIVPSLLIKQFYLFPLVSTLLLNCNMG